MLKCEMQLRRIMNRIRKGDLPFPACTAHGRRRVVYDVPAIRSIRLPRKIARVYDTRHFTLDYVCARLHIHLHSS